jgi:hypothetical protein
MVLPLPLPGGESLCLDLCVGAEYVPERPHRCGDGGVDGEVDGLRQGELLCQVDSFEYLGNAWTEFLLYNISRGFTVHIYGHSSAVHPPLLILWCNLLGGSPGNARCGRLRRLSVVALTSEEKRMGLGPLMRPLLWVSVASVVAPTGTPGQVSSRKSAFLLMWLSAAGRV